MSQKISVPDLGDFHDVEVIDVLVKPGDKIDVDTPLITLETEKATMDVPSSAAGVVKAIAIKKGDRVSKGNVIAQIEADSGSQIADSSEKEAAPAASSKPAAPPPAAETPKQQAAPAKAAAPPPPSVPTANREPLSAAVDFSSVHASPSIRKFARELGVDLTAVKGS